MTIPDDYIDPEHKGTAKRMLHVFYSATSSDGGTVDEIYLRGIKAVLQDDNLAARPLLETLLSRMEMEGVLPDMQDQVKNWLNDNPATAE